MSQPNAESGARAESRTNRKRALAALYGSGCVSPPPGALPAALAFVLRHPAWVLAVTLVLAAGGGWAASTMPLITDFSLLIPEHARSVQDQRAGDPFLGNTSLVTVLVEWRGPRGGADEAGEGEAGKDQAGEGDPGDGDIAREAAAAIAERLARDEAFAQVVFEFDRTFFEHNALLYLTTEQLADLHRRINSRILSEINPFFIDIAGDLEGPDVTDPAALVEHYTAGRDGGGVDASWAREYLASDDGRTYLILVQPEHAAADIDYNKQILARIEQHVADSGVAAEYGPALSVSLAGNYRSTVEENDAAKRDLGMSGLVALALLLAIIFAYFRRVRATYTIFVPLLSGVAVMMGYVWLAVGHLNTITGFCFALFMGLSIDFAIHMLARYDEERGRGRPMFDALLETYRHTGNASVVAAATTSAGFLALIAADFRGFREFGIIAGGGIVVCLLVIAAQLPAIIAVSARFVRERRFASFNPEAALSRSRPPRYGTVAVIGLVVVAALVVSARDVAWEDDFRNLRGGTDELLELNEEARAIMGQSSQPVVRIADTRQDAARLADACNAERRARGEDSAVQICVSLQDFLPENQDERLAWIRKIAGLLTDDRLEQIEEPARSRLLAWRDRIPSRPVTEGDLPRELVQTFVSAHGHKYFMKAYPSVQTWKGSSNVRISDELMAGDDVLDTDIGPLGAAMIMADLIRVMRRDSRLVVAIALAAVLVILIAIFRSPVRALACYLPLIVGIACTVGLMVLAGGKLGFFNMIVLPSLIGIGVDNNIHLYHRYRAEGRGSWPYVVQTTGRACMMAAVTTMAGFAGLSLGGHLGLRTIGNLAILGITTCTLVSLVLMPAVFGVLERRLSGSALGLLPAHEFAPPGDAPAGDGDGDAPASDGDGDDEPESAERGDEPA